MKDYKLIKEIFETGKKKLGWRGIQMNLTNEKKIVMNHKKIIRIMKKYRLFVKIRTINPYKTMAKKTQEHRVFDNKLKREFKQETPLAVLCTDITYLHYRNHRAYLSVIKDIASKDIASGEAISWKLSQGLGLGIVLDTIKTMENKINISKFKDTIIHSDQGFHYTSPEYSKKIKDLGMIQSMSRKGNCIDNAPIESFFGHFKDDVDYYNCKTFEELNLVVNEYMEYYNNKRYQWNLKKMTPVQYRNHLLEKI